jgi:hypothetical protein
MKNPVTFPHPIGIMLFNRLKYAQQFLESLSAQTLPVDQSKLYISIDGYRGSKDELQGKPDNTQAVEELARALFPNATIRRMEKNIGIAECLRYLEDTLLASHSDATWWGKFEEDYVLSPDYLAITAQMSSAAEPIKDIAMVSATGETLDPDKRNVEGIFPMGHLWAYFVRVEHVRERRDDLQLFREQMSSKPYWDREKVPLALVMASRGVFPIGVANDHQRLGLVFKFNRIAVTTGLSYGQYIGAEGEHMTAESFARFNFSPPTTVPFDISTVDFPASLSNLRDQFRADFAKRLAERYVIHKIRAFSAQKSFKSLPRARRVVSLLGSAFRELFVPNAR